MSAKQDRTRLPLGNEFASTIAQLKAIADRSHDAALTEGEVNRDRHLLDLCSDALHALKHAEKIHKEWRSLWDSDRPLKDETRARCEALHAEQNSLENQAKQIMYRAKKMPAKTPAGIYAKAMLVRASVTGAAHLAMSLAEDMVNCKELRAVLWAPEFVASGD